VAHAAAVMNSGTPAAGGQIRITILKRRGDQRKTERDEQQDGRYAPHATIVPPAGNPAYTGYVMKHVNRFLHAHNGPWACARRLAAIFAIAAASYAQTAPAKKSFQFHGKVTAVSSDGLTIDGDKVEGWMEKMTMKYKVDDPKVLKTVKTGDEINATVYEGDLTLHKVAVAGKTKK
jgi:Cu/Ag efflux protein CusF